MHMYRGKNTSNIHASCMHKEKRATNIGVVRIYGEREKDKEQSCMQNVSVVRIFGKRKRRVAIGACDMDTRARVIFNLKYFKITQNPQT